MAHVRDRQDGETRLARRVRRPGFPRDRGARATGGGYECSAIDAEVRVFLFLFEDYSFFFFFLFRADLLTRIDRKKSAHTQAVAYVIGETAAEKIVAEYKQR